MAEQEDEESRLLNLPAEIRNNIYELALVEECVTIPCARPALLQTCTQIRGEATAIYYTLNRFATTFKSDIKELHHWLANSPKHNSTLMVQNLTVYCEVSADLCSHYAVIAAQLLSAGPQSVIALTAADAREVVQRELSLHVAHLQHLHEIGMNLGGLHFFSQWGSVEALSSERWRRFVQQPRGFTPEEGVREARDSFVAIWKAKMEARIKVLCRQNEAKLVGCP